MSNLTHTIHLAAEIPEESAGQRLDQTLAQLFPEHSRSRLKTWVEEGWVLVNGKPRRPRDKVLPGEQIEIRAEIEAVSDWGAESIPIDVVFEDEHLLVINKPAGFVVHPGAGNRAGTLVNALLHRIPSLNQIPRAGVVHRLDKDTTGLMVVAKTLIAQTKLVTDLQARNITRVYEAVVYGILPAGGTVNAPMGRHPRDRVRMAVVDLGKPAVTHYRIIEKFKAHTHLRIQLETGRTHQIRVHMAHIHHPIVGDKVYGRLRLPPNASETLRNAIQTFPRQALHAKLLTLHHPVTGVEMTWEAPLPEDMKAFLSILKTN